jgi:hypothetical protein
LWLQHVVAGEPHFPDDREVDQQLDLEIHPAPPPPPEPAAVPAGEQTASV